MKRIRLFLALCLIALLLPVLPAAAEAAQELGIAVTAPTDTVTAGEEFTVTVSLTGYTGEDPIVGLQTDIGLSEQLEIEAHETGIVDEEALFNATSHQTEAGTARLLYVTEGDASLPVITEELYTVRFRLTDGVTGRGTIELPLTAKLRAQSMTQSVEQTETIRIAYSVAASVTSGSSTQYYSSLTEALTNAGEGDIVTLLAEPDPGEQIGQTVTIVPNGFSLPCAGGWAAADNGDGTWKVAKAAVSHYGQNLRLQDLLKIGFYFQVNTELPVDRMGALLWTAEDYAAETDFTVTSGSAKNYLKPVAYGKVYCIESDGIYVQNLDDVLYMIPYAKIGDSYVYGDAKKYSALDYCQWVYNTEDPSFADAKTLVIDLLNYATAARAYFCITEGLTKPADSFNSFMDPEDQTVKWSEELRSSYPAVEETGSFKTTLYGLNINLLDAVSIGVYYQNAADITGGYFWNAAGYASQAEHTAENATGVTVDEKLSGNYRKLNVKGLYAYNLYDNYYVRPYNASGQLGDTVGVSAAAYLTQLVDIYGESTKPVDLAVVELAKAMQVYGMNAKDNPAINKN